MSDSKTNEQPRTVMEEAMRRAVQRRAIERPKQQPQQPQDKKNK